MGLMEMYTPSEYLHDGSLPGGRAQQSEHEKFWGGHSQDDEHGGSSYIV